MAHQTDQSGEPVGRALQESGPRDRPAEGATGRPASPRQRYRQRVREEIKDHAWAQVASSGASALSLNAIAKRMGLSGPALYRYFPNRDALITDMILDAYQDLDATCRAAAVGDTRARRTASLAHALRRWALADPHRYLLLYGTPVPGYSAPPRTTALARSIMTTLLDAVTAPTATEVTAGQPPGPAMTALEQHLATHRAWAPDHPAPPAALRTALTVWTRLHGVISLELAGHFTGMDFDPERLFAAELETLLDEPG